MNNSKTKTVQVSILTRIYGNVNADEVIGTRVTLKKMYSTTGEVLPFVSARAIKYSIRQALKERGYEVDPFVEDPKATEALRLRDSGRPDKYIDNDLFGYMVTMGRREQAVRRQAPISFSYLKALKDTSIVTEFAARFPRSLETGSNPVPFEVEVADFLGKLNCLIYDYIGDFSGDKRQPGAPADLPERLPDGERKRRLRDFLEILLTPAYVLPRRTNSLNLPEYYASLVTLSHGPLPIYQYLDYDFEEEMVDPDKLEGIKNLRPFADGTCRAFLIDYKGVVKDSRGIKVSSLNEVI
ncbi:MAG: type I-B CRISPR-associated protein Cas7/Cst2/DevR, partial [Candidatus Bathyarchaeia archaeon]